MSTEARLIRSPWGPREAVAPGGRSRVRNLEPTTLAERLLLSASAALLPLQDTFGSVGGVSPIFLLFAGMGLYTLLFRATQLISCALHRISIAAYLLIAVLIQMELLHPDPSFKDIVRLGLMIMGAILIATLCRDQAALRSLLWGVLISGTALALYMFFISYGHLSASTAANFRDASHLRMRAFEESELQANLNKLAFISGQGAVVAVGWALLERRPWLRAGLLITALICLVAAFLPLSRSGMIIAVIACGLLLLRSGKSGQMRALLFVGVIIAVLWLWVPQAAFARLTFSAERVSEDSRERVYTRAIETSEKYLPLGVGFGQYWSKWAAQNGFSAHVDGQLIPIGSHNVPLQILICAGVPGLAALMIFVWMLSRVLPPGELNPDELSLFGLVIAAGFLMLVTHQFYDKSFSQTIGVLIGCSLWLWPVRHRPVSSN